MDQNTPTPLSRRSLQYSHRKLVLVTVGLVAGMPLAVGQTPADYYDDLMLWQTQGRGRLGAEEETLTRDESSTTQNQRQSHCFIKENGEVPCGRRHGSVLLDRPSALRADKH